MLDKNELESRYRNLEADNVERTQSGKDKDKIGEAICAFSNDLGDHREPGVLFIGQKDDGSCSGLSITDDLLLNLVAFRTDGNIHPFPEISVVKTEIDGCTVAVIEVLPSGNPPVRYKGRTCIRVGPRRGYATADEERRLTEKRRWGTLSFDQHAAVGATLGDLDVARFHLEYLPSIVPAEVLADNGRNQVEQMRSLRLLTAEGVPTNLAILLLGKETRRWLPGAYIQFVRYDGKELTDAIKDQKEVSGPLVDQLRLIDEIFLANIAVASDSSGVQTHEKPDYPIIALRELIRNAVIHRNYEGTAAPVRVYWYVDRIEIMSPGGPYGQVTIESFGSSGVTDYRNPALAEAAKAMGFVYRFGTGIARAQSELKKNGNPLANFSVYPTRIHATVWQ